MPIKPIRSDADLHTTLARIDGLMDAEPGTLEGDELEVLATLVDLYEGERFPIHEPSPIEAIRFRMDQQDLGLRDLEPIFGSRSRASEVLSGARPLSIDMIRALYRHLRIPAEVLISDEPMPAATANLKLSKAAEQQLASWGVLKAHEGLASLMSRAFGPGPAVALLRKTRTARTNAKTDYAALQAWCATAMIKSEVQCLRGIFNPSRIDGDTIRQLAKLSSHHDGPILAREALSELGVAFVVLPHLPGTHLDGAAMRRLDGCPVIALTLRRDRIDNFWFTLLHEFAHVAKHLSVNRALILDDLEIASSEEIECEADTVAQVGLLPAEFWQGLRSGVYASVTEIHAISKAAGVHVSIVAGRWQREHRDFRRFAKLLGHGTIRKQFPEFTQ